MCETRTPSGPCVCRGSTDCMVCCTLSCDQSTYYLTTFPLPMNLPSIVYGRVLRHHIEKQLNVILRYLVLYAALPVAVMHASKRIVKATENGYV